MPGGRLTHEDRRRIATWLADGLGYAEMGRRLGRPTSTITREVARNGGPAGYRPDRAQRAAELRARRSRKAAAGDPGQAQAGPGTEEARRFVEEFATLLTGTGLPRMPARVFVCLLTADTGSLTSADLVRLLRVSPASVSKAIGFLESLGLAERGPDAGGRRERYRVEDDVWLRAWKADVGAHAQVAEAARQGVDLFGPGTPQGRRLREMGRFFTRISDHMTDNDLTQAVAADALTVIAALVHAARPLTADDLAASLGWPAGRTAAALNALLRRPALTDPLTVERSGRGAYSIAARPDRLSPAQRQALAPRPSRTA
ncbi:GbsR/MarR family transcriptional regulator [Bailinhaonella thermotolerans]|uniref:MarR family transcriptional regulator n=1 Tax=Bailinhaonella thermotolerans TaxID=1070861 RepID=A0A3A4A3H1_9ACTN|nr:helix-turn-helix domain-containing protein [Bailinhaonella thermotolerans]RJL22995.1 MarR family transcriptional regulator [Bailinhaonella thermotolerans]